MSNQQRNSNPPRNADDAMVRLLVETMAQQNRDLEAGLSMYLTKKGPAEEKARLIEKAKAQRALLRKIKDSMAQKSMPAQAR